MRDSHGGDLRAYWTNVSPGARDALRANNVRAGKTQDHSLQPPDASTSVTSGVTLPFCATPRTASPEPWRAHHLFGVVEKLVLLGDARVKRPGNEAVRTDQASHLGRAACELDRLGFAVAHGSGVPKPGKQLFDQQCLRCHTLFGKGGSVGPDLTTYRRDDLATMLLNIVNPSTVIQEGYATLIVSLVDGRVLSGVVVEQDKNVVVLRGSDGTDVTLARADIDAMRPALHRSCPRVYSRA